MSLHLTTPNGFREGPDIGNVKISIGIPRFLKYYETTHTSGAVSRRSARGSQSMKLAGDDDLRGCLASQRRSPPCEMPLLLHREPRSILDGFDKLERPRLASPLRSSRDCSSLARFAM